MSTDRLQRAQMRSFQIHTTVQVKWYVSLVVYKQFEGAENLKMFSLIVPYQIFPLVDLSVSCNAVMRVKQIGDKYCCFPNCSRIRTHSFTTRQNKKSLLNGWEETALDTIVPILMFL